MIKVKDLKGIIASPMGMREDVVTARYTRDHRGMTLSLEHKGLMFIVAFEDIVLMIQGDDTDPRRNKDGNEDK